MRKRYENFLVVLLKHYEERTSNKSVIDFSTINHRELLDRINFYIQYFDCKPYSEIEIDGIVMQLEEKEKQLTL